MTMISERYFAQTPNGVWSQAVRSVQRLLEAIESRQRCRQAEAALRAASDRQLRDMGIDRSEITSVVWGRGRDRDRRCNAYD